MSWRQGLDRRRADAARLDERITRAAPANSESYAATGPDRQVVINDLARASPSCLPPSASKLDEPEPPTIDNKFVPMSRATATPTSDLRPLTLISLASELARSSRVPSSRATRTRDSS